MALNFKTPEEAADEYLLHLKGLKPNLNTQQTDSDWYIRSRVVGGVVSGVYADQKLLQNDAFPQSARHAALEQHLIMLFGSGFKSSTESQGPVKVTGSEGSTIPALTEFVYTPNGNVYQSTEEVVLDGPSGIVPVKSVGTGQSQNLLEGSSLSLSSPPAGIDSTAEVYGESISDGRDSESDEQAVERCLARYQSALRGGAPDDYKLWAIEADDAVASVSVLRFAFGFGTIGIIISAGTTDIDAALDAGESIVTTPSQDLIDTVQAYIDAKKPVTDSPYVMGANEIPIDVTVRARFAVGTASTVPAGQTLTQAQLIEREVKRAIYKTPVGGRQISGVGYVVASEIEEVIDQGLSATVFVTGKLPILVDRAVDDLAASGMNRMILGNEVAVPGTITIVEL